MLKNSVIISVFITVPAHALVNSVDNINTKYLEVMKNTDLVEHYSSEKIKDKILRKKVIIKYSQEAHQFGVTSIDTPFIVNGIENKKVDQAYFLLSKIGVDNVKSGAADWQRIDDDKGGFTNLSDLNYQLAEAKKYGLSTSFIIGYPPRKYSNYGKSIRSAVKPEYLDKYNDYLKFIITYLKDYDVKYLELANEVDAPRHWWIRSSPEMYVHQMKILKEAINKINPSLKTIAFSATYSRNEALGGKEGGRRFIERCFQLGIDKFVDVYSYHHFSYWGDDNLPQYMEDVLKKHNIKKPIFNTEQLDTTQRQVHNSKPYNIIKVFAKGFFDYNAPYIDYFMARDAFVEQKVYPNGFTQGLFDINWNPKPRLLAYAMAVDVMKDRELISHFVSKNSIEVYLLKNKKNNSPYKYSALLWLNDNGHARKTVSVNLSTIPLVETWDLDTYHKPNSFTLSQAPIALFSNSTIDIGKIVNGVK
ncbi:hypothetical protein JHU04_000056 [Brenneria sp. 4F2]|nr:hypothetical protein [Brenneria bubanii]